MYSLRSAIGSASDEVGGTHNHAGERLWEHQGARFVKRHHDMLHATTTIVFVPRLRLRLLNKGAKADAEQRPSDQHWHEKQSQPCQPQTNRPPRYQAAISRLAAHCCSPLMPRSVGSHCRVFLT